MTAVKHVGGAVVHVVALVLSGAFAIGDKVLHAVSAIVSNEFFLMGLAIVGFLLLMNW